MNFLLLILLDISASDDDHPYLSIARRPLEALIADWVRQGEEINLLRILSPGRLRPVLRGANLFRLMGVSENGDGTLAVIEAPGTAADLPASLLKITVQCNILYLVERRRYGQR